jgi:Domain of unknown function (DUF4167)
VQWLESDPAARLGICVPVAFLPTFMKVFAMRRPPRIKRNNRPVHQGRNFSSGRNGGSSQNSGGMTYDRRARANAQKNIEKYQNMARDAVSDGDIVQAEYWYQHVDHYQRVINACDEQDRAMAVQPDALQDDSSSGDTEADTAALPQERGTGQQSQHQNGQNQNGNGQHYGNRQNRNDHRNDPRSDQQQGGQSQNYTGGQNHNGQGSHSGRNQNTGGNYGEAGNGTGSGNENGGNPRRDRDRPRRYQQPVFTDAAQQQTAENSSEQLPPRQDRQQQPRIPSRRRPLEGDTEQRLDAPFLMNAPQPVIRQQPVAQPVAPLPAAAMPVARAPVAAITPDPVLADTGDTPPAPRRRGRPRKNPEGMAASV